MGALNSGVEEPIGPAPMLRIHGVAPSSWFSRIDQGRAALGEYRASPLSRRLRGERHKDCTSILNVHASKLVSNGRVCGPGCAAAAIWLGDPSRAYSRLGLGWPQRQ